MLSFDGKINSFVLGYHLLLLLLLLHEHALSASENVRNKRALTIGVWITQHLASSVTRLDLTKKENMLLFV